MAQQHMNAGRPIEAISHIVQAIVEEPGNSRYTRAFANWIAGHRVRGLGESLEKALIISFAEKSLKYPPLFPTWLAALQEKDTFSFLKEIQNGKSYEEFMQGLGPATFESVTADPLLLAGLPVLFSRNAALEKALTYIRRGCLENFVSQLSGPLPFLSALGLHCFYNEFVFSVSEHEQHLLAELKHMIESSDFDVMQAPTMVALYSCYRPLFTLTNADALRPDANTLPLIFQELIKRQVDEPAEEQAIKKDIPALTPIRNAVSQAVRQQYEDNPYPRWHSWPKADPSPQSPQIGGITILNAGCGTGQSPISAAVQYPLAQITGLDLSLASLAYGARKAKEMGIKNIRFVQGDILELTHWQEEFHVIMSGGVLHHLDDPLRGWQTLTKLLKPNGVMKIGLYSERGRKNIIEAQKWIKERGLLPTEEGIRAFREHVFACDPSDPLKPLADHFIFYSMSNLRDMVFHIKEHRFTCLDLQSMLERMNLRFLGFHSLAPEIKPEYLKRFPSDTAMTNLENWDRWEQEHPITFANMFVFWCCRAYEIPGADLPHGFPPAVS